jgi:tight adherence protein B
MDNLLLAFAVAAFLAVVLLLEGAYLLWNSYRGAEARKIQSRLREVSRVERVSLDSKLLRQRVLSQSPRLARILARAQTVHTLDQMLLQSGLKQTVAGFLGATAAWAVAGFFIWAAFPLPFWSAPFVILGLGALPGLRLMRARKKRIQAIEQQLPEALDLMSRALRAGHAFPSALQMVGDEGPQPIAGEFSIAFDQANYGVLMQDALGGMAKRVPIADLRFFVIAVAIQRETGGNLTELLDKLSTLVRERFKLLGTIRVLSAEGRLSAWILTALPFVLLALINLINPKFMSILWTDPAGIAALWSGGIFIVIGVLWMWRVTKIRV